MILLIVDICLDGFCNIPALRGDCGLLSSNAFFLGSPGSVCSIFGLIMTIFHRLFIFFNLRGLLVTVLVKDRITVSIYQSSFFAFFVLNRLCGSLAILNLVVVLGILHIVLCIGSCYFCSGCEICTGLFISCRGSLALVICARILSGCGGLLCTVVIVGSYIC